MQCCGYIHLLNSALALNLRVQIAAIFLQAVLHFQYPFVHADQHLNSNGGRREIGRELRNEKRHFSDFFFRSTKSFPWKTFAQCIFTLFQNAATFFLLLTLQGLTLCKHNMHEFVLNTKLEKCDHKMPVDYTMVNCYKNI